MRTRTAHPVAGLVGRLTWMLLGPAALFLAAMAIVRRDGWLTWPDITFLAALAAMTLGRWLEYLAGDARTATGEPATLSDVRRYTVWALGVGLGAWTAVNLWANS